MKKLFVAFAAALLALAPLSAHAGSFAGTRWSTPRQIQWAPTSTTTADTAFIAAYPDTHRTVMIDASDLDWRVDMGQGATIGPMHLIAITVVCPTPVADGDSLWVTQEPTYDNGATYQQNFTLSSGAGGTGTSVLLFRDTNYPTPSIGPSAAGLPEVFRGFIDIDGDIAANAPAGTGQTSAFSALFTDKFRLRVAGPSGQTPLLSGCKLYISYPVSGVNWGLAGANYLGDRVRQVPISWNDPSGAGTAADTTFFQSSADTVRTQTFSMSDLDWPIVRGVSASMAAEHMAKFVVECYGANNQVSDTLWAAVEPSWDGGTTIVPQWDTMKNLATNGNVFPLIRQTMNGSSGTCFVGFLNADFDAASITLQAGQGCGIRDFRLKIYGDITGSGPAISNCKGWLFYPAPRISY